MSIKAYFKILPLEFFSRNISEISEEQGKCFHHDLKESKKKHQD